MKKYKMSKNSTVWSIVLSAIFVIVYIILLFCENKISLIATKTNDNYEQSLIAIDIFKNIILVGVSVFLSSLLSAALIEKNSLNNMYFNDVVSDLMLKNKFHKQLPRSTQEQLLTDIEYNIFPYNNKIKKDMVSKLRNKLLAKNEDYYYEECQTTVSCKVQSDKILKEFKRKIKIRSYAGEKSLNNFRFSSSTLESINGITPFRVYGITLNNNQLTANKDYEVTSDIVHDTIHKKGGYNISYACVSKKPIKVYDNKDTVIEIKYTTVVKPSDTVLAVRVYEHCKKYSLKFKITNSDKYHIYATAYGFLDDAKQTLNSDDPNDIAIEFNDWIYKGDGVAIFFQKT